jgi:3-mercaptopropionate dioxygenase
MTGIAKLRDFVVSFTHLVATEHDEPSLIAEGRLLLTELVVADDWLPTIFAVPHPQHYQQYLLHCDPLERFSVVSFVWGPGQETPVHDHRTWGLVGVLRGAEISRRYVRLADGRLQALAPERLDRGSVDAVSPTIGDLHDISNAFADRSSISIHVYGANIGTKRRAVYNRETGEEKPFVSGYVDAYLPNLWRSQSV